MSLLEVRDLRHAFYRVPVLNGVDFSVEAHEFAGLVGPNGAGKSTLYNAISGLFIPDAGTVTFDGHDITRMTPHERVALGLVRTFQMARGFPKLTVFQNLMLYAQDNLGEGLLASLFGSRTGKQAEEAAAAEALAIAHRLRLDHVIDNPLTALSGGQKKLVEIGRALMARPKMILLDEPMAGVNPTLTQQIADHLRGLNADGITICLIEHDMPLIGQLCNPVTVLAEGRTLMKGTFDAVISNLDVQEAYLGARKEHA
ncbi:ABC transporter, ATP-binding protein, putative (plasmid) [Ketogulonicigenium robustum]|uniref:ABC transporter, ATP-binding protein, putative n=1 Tax=Ketogulonicigenium robustum TaxID=92947 RepID=A0A1W6P3Q0_9RHOB|nr:ABC transporter ATP-binding protein [Ketogulonicigenium robustum]ARO16011.1 ABC transporter, ATP-binding protein, putative [Ketogulonicigenium robustum]